MEGRLLKAGWQKEDGLLDCAVVDNVLPIRSGADQSRATVTTGLVSQLHQSTSEGYGYYTEVDFVVATVLRKLILMKGER